MRHSPTLGLLLCSGLEGVGKRRQTHTQKLETTKDQECFLFYSHLLETFEDSSYIPPNTQKKGDPEQIKANLKTFFVRIYFTFRNSSTIFRDFICFVFFRKEGKRMTKKMKRSRRVVRLYVYSEGNR